MKIYFIIMSIIVPFFHAFEKAVGAGTTFFRGRITTQIHNKLNFKTGVIFYKIFYITCVEIMHEAKLHTLNFL
jgi:hypothetical protein